MCRTYEVVKGRSVVEVPLYISGQHGVFTGRYQLSNIVNLFGYC